MARVHLLKPEELTGKEREAYEKLNAENRISNMKLVMLQDYGTFLAYMGWYDSWASLEKTVGLRAATIYAHAISTTNGCMLCSLFFISDLKALGLDPDALVLDEKEEILVALGQQIVKDPTAVSDELIEALRKYYTDREIIAIIAFAPQMQATNNFNSVLGVDIDERLLPIKDQFKPVHWRERREENE